MEDPNTTKNLRSKEKVQLMIEGVMESQQSSSKKQDIPINIAIVATADNISHQAFVIFTKKNKKIDIILPVIAEFQILDVDSLNFEVFWDPNAVNERFTPNALPSTYRVPDGVPVRIRVICNHAGEKKTFIERIMMSKKVTSPERNTFANGKTHQWLWHYQSLMPKCTQVKSLATPNQQPANSVQSQGPTSEEIASGSGGGNLGQGDDQIYIDQQLNNIEKLKETIEQIKSSNKQMSQMAMNIFVKQELEKRQHEYMTYKDLSILTYTWNVNGQKPNCDQIEDVFSVKNIALDIQNIKIQKIEDIPDLIIFNFQEIVPLSAKSMITTGVQPQQWENYIIQKLNKWLCEQVKEQLEIQNVQLVEKLASHVQMGLFQVILYKKDAQKVLKDHQLAQVGTGILGVGGNKGAIGCSIKVCETKLAVVNAHLAASQSKVQRRNQNVNQILKSLLFNYKNDEVYNLFEHDILLWCGDLNYRIASDDFHDVVDKIHNNKLAELRTLDQLLQEKQAGNVFTELEEAKLKFPPTYKYKVGTNDYDFKSGKVRIPAWCDRILFRGENLQQMFYTSISSPTLSDHKPVASLFKIKYKMIDPHQQKVVSQQILEYLKTLKDNFVPKLKISQTDINFTDLSYGDTQTITLDFVNEGDGLLEFDISKISPLSVIGGAKNEFGSTCLSIEPLRGVIKAGEKVAINVKLQISHREAQLLFFNQVISESIGISTNEENQERHYLNIKCQYLRSCFGAPLSILNLCTGLDNKSIRDELQNIKPQDIFKLMRAHEEKEGDGSLPIPKELYRMANFIMEHGKTAPNIFLSSGNAHSQRTIREKIDTGVPLTQGEDDVLTVAFVLMDFLQTLITPILPVHILNEIVAMYETEGDKNEHVVQKLLLSLPKDNSMAFVYLLSFFREMLSCADKNKLTPEKISEILCECLVGEDKFSQITSKTFRLEHALRADTALGGKRRMMSQVSPGKSRSFVRKDKNRLSQLVPGSTAAAVDENDEIDEENEEKDEQNLSIEQLKSKLRYQGLLLHFFA